LRECVKKKKAFMSFRERVTAADKIREICGKAPQEKPKTAGRSSPERRGTGPAKRGDPKKPIIQGQWGK